MASSLVRSSQFAWRPYPAGALQNLQRFKATVALQTDYGTAQPAQRPKLSPATMLYVTEPKGREGSFRRYIQSAKKEVPLITGALVGVALYSAATLAIPAGFGQLIDFASRGEMPMGTSVRLLGWFGLAGIGNVTRLACIGIAGERVIAKLRERLYRAILAQPTAFFDSPDNRTGALVQRLSMDCNVVGSSLTEAVMQGSKNLLQTVGSIGIMLYYSPMLTGVICSMIPPLAVFAGSYGRYVRRLQHNMQDALAEKATVAEERLSNIRTVKAFAHEAEELKWYSLKVNNVFEISKRMLLWNASYSASLQTLGYGALYGIMWAGSMLVASNQLTPGVLFSFVLYTVYCGIGLMGLTNLATEINKGYGASLRLFDVVDREEQRMKEEALVKKTIPLTCKWHIKLEAVDFSYPTRPEARVYDQLSLEIKPSRCTCVVGSSGSGKSSLALLLLKLYEPTGGQLTVDGVNVNDLDTQWLRGHVGYVGQEPVLFGGSVAQNIAYGTPGHNWDQPMDRWLYSSVVEAAIKANAHDFITALPDGYDTFVGEGGRSLSGGQKQRIAIARALLRNPNVLILDEATSALDSESEVVVHDAISRLIEASKVTQHRTVLMFAHKLSMIRKADHIIVLDNGRVAVEGTFEEVCGSPLFCQLVGLTPTRIANGHKAEQTVPSDDSEVSATDTEALNQNGKAHINGKPSD